MASLRRSTSIRASSADIWLVKSSRSCKGRWVLREGDSSSVSYNHRNQTTMGRAVCYDHALMLHWFPKRIFIENIIDIFWPGRKLGKLGNLRKLGNFFPSFSNPSFRFEYIGQYQNLGTKKLGKKFPRFPRFPSFPSFRIATFSRKEWTFS